MNILDLLEKDGISPTYKATTDGGEYSSSCPWCGGTDRFLCWPKEKNGGKWWCRQCGRSGDLIQYLRDFRGMTYREACRFLKLTKTPYASNINSVGSATVNKYDPSKTEPPPQKWQKIMKTIIEKSKERLTLSRYRHIKEYLEARGVKSRAIERYSLGWNAEDLTYQRSSLDLPVKVDDRGNTPAVWIPEGLVIPCHRNGIIQKVNIRRSVRGNLNAPPEDGNRYVMVAGSHGRINMLLGESKDYFVVVESDLDAILLHQLAGDIVTVVALGSAANKPDCRIMKMLEKARVILVALDNDEAGIKATYGWWLPCFPNARRWLVPNGKDPGEGYQSGLDLKIWVQAGLPR